MLKLRGSIRGRATLAATFVVMICGLATVAVSPSWIVDAVGVTLVAAASLTLAIPVRAGRDCLPLARRAIKARVMALLDLTVRRVHGDGGSYQPQLGRFPNGLNPVSHAEPVTRFGDVLIDCPGRDPENGGDLRRAVTLGSET